MAVLKEKEIRTLVVGTGAAGYAAAVRLHRCGERNLAILTEDVKAGTSRNTGSDKQTYYKLSLAGREPDSVRGMAEDLFAGQCVDGDLALCEAALSARCFYYLTELGVPFPDNAYGEYVGYQTDHDRKKRASSVGPYTSRIMTECLEREAAARRIPVLDGMQPIRILVREEKVRGVLCLNRRSTEGEDAEFFLIWCETVILATGGPAGMYRDSVYPASQTGSSGIAFEAGVLGKNLTEWQFGLASRKPRWNVSGTYMQALPRFLSADREGKDEREFLMEHFQDAARVQYLTFLKGYQWPFDAAKSFEGSSLIDLLVYQETILKGRRVFLDFCHNPGGESVEFERLPQEARDYLQSAGACFGTPFQRLAHMNEPAVSFYREHGVDLEQEMLEIAVCVQHNNGGLSVDCHWQTNIEGVFAVGEVCGSHGVSRPGGTALNAGQVGALRAAEYIVYEKGRKPWKQTEKERDFCRRQAWERIALSVPAKEGCDLQACREKAARRMSGAAGMIRSEKGLEAALRETEEELRYFERDVRITEYRQAGMLYHLLDMLLSQKVYLSAMLDYIRRGGKSRGSALYTCPDGKKPEEGLPELYRCSLDGGKLGGTVQEIRLFSQEEGGVCRTVWRPVRPLPEPDDFFETQWKSFRERKGRACGATVFHPR